EVVFDQLLADVLFGLLLEIAGGDAPQHDGCRLPHRHPEHVRHRRKELTLALYPPCDDGHDDRVGDPSDHLRGGEDRSGEEGCPSHGEDERERAGAGEASDETEALSDDDASRDGGGRGGHGKLKAYRWPGDAETDLVPP